MKKLFKKLLSSAKKAKTNDCKIKFITTQWRGTHIEFDVKNKTLFYKNVISSRDAGNRYSDGFFDVHSVKLNDINFEACIEQAERCFDQIPFESEYPFLGLPGASLDTYMECVDVQENRLYYTNTHSQSFSLNEETVHEEFVRFFELLTSQCDFHPICTISENVQNDNSNYDSRYFEETLWMCKICGGGNLFESRCCVKCGEDRGW